MVIYTVERMRDAGILDRLFDQCRFFPGPSTKFQIIMEIVSGCAISMVFGVVQLVVMVMVAIHPSSSSLYHVGVNECFERVSIGKRLNASDVSRSVMNTTLRQCDIECEREMCNAYTFGIGPRGNGSCEISVQLPKSPPTDDADYDLFVRILQCRNMTTCQIISLNSGIDCQTYRLSEAHDIIHSICVESV